MALYDVVVVGLFVGFMARGWTRGLVRQVIDVGLLLLGSVVVFRMSPAIGSTGRESVRQLIPKRSAFRRRASHAGPNSSSR